jgi:hypothetical protein
MTKRIRAWAVAGCTLLLSAPPLGAQLANPLPSALGLGENFTAAARGYAAVSWNPAALGLDDGPQSSAMIGAVRGLSGLGPVTLGDLRTWQDRVVPQDVRQRWLADIRQAGGQAGVAGFDVTWATFQVGRFAAQVASSGTALSDIPTGLAELMLVGNADETGAPVDIGLGGSFVDAAVHTTGGLSFGVPLPLPGATRAAVGITAKYTIGHVLGISQESAGAATAQPTALEFRFPLVYTPVVHDDLGSYWLSAGGGFGLDVAGTVQLGTLTLAAVAHNVVNRFAWDHERLRYRPLELVFSEGSIESAVEWQPLSAAPDDVRALVDASTFEPSFSAGAALQWSRGLLFTADARYGSTDGMHTRAPRHVGAGVEYRPVPWLPLQVGTAWVGYGNDRTGIQLAAGAGAQLGSFLVSVGAARRETGFGSENTVMLSLLSHTF